MLFSVEQAFVGREEIRDPLKTPAWETKLSGVDCILIVFIAPVGIKCHMN